MELGFTLIGHRRELLDAIAALRAKSRGMSTDEDGLGLVTLAFNNNAGLGSAGQGHADGRQGRLDRMETHHRAVAVQGRDVRHRVEDVNAG
jgi:hypothetical protein